MATSHSYREIARELVVSEETVRTHAKSVLGKLGQHDRTELWSGR
jgi:DNA-binding NarL/FixJ family response regulator